MYECLVRGTREAPEAVRKDSVWERRRAYNPKRQVIGESDESIVVKKPANNIKPPITEVIAEQVERRGSAKRNPETTPEVGTQRPAGSESWRTRIRAAARRDKALRFNNLFHHITLELLEQSYRLLKRNAAPGVDGIDWYEYGEGLLERLTRLHECIQQGRYRPQPVKRQWIDKADGGKRALGMTTTETRSCNRRWYPSCRRSTKWISSGSVTEQDRDAVSTTHLMHCI